MSSTETTVRQSHEAAQDAGHEALALRPVADFATAISQYQALHGMLARFAAPESGLPADVRGEFAGYAKSLGETMLTESKDMMRSWQASLDNVGRTAVREEGDIAGGVAVMDAQRAISSLIAQAEGTDRFTAENQRIASLRETISRANVSLAESEEAYAGIQQSVREKTGGERTAALKAQASALGALGAMRKEIQGHEGEIESIQAGIAAALEADQRMRESDTLGTESLAAGVRYAQATHDLIAGMQAVANHTDDATLLILGTASQLQAEVEVVSWKAQDYLTTESALAMMSGDTGRTAGRIVEAATRIRDAFGTADLGLPPEGLGLPATVEQDLRTIQRLYVPGTNPVNNPELMPAAIEALDRVFGAGNGTPRNYEVAMAGLLYLMRSYGNEDVQTAIHGSVVRAISNGPLNREQGEVFFQLLAMDESDLSPAEFKGIVAATGGNPTAVAHALAWDSMRSKEVRDAARALRDGGDPGTVAIVNGALAKSSGVDFSAPRYKDSSSLTDEEAYSRITQIMNPGFKPLNAENPARVISGLKADILRVFQPGQHSEAEYLVADVAISILMRQYDKDPIQAAYKDVSLRATQLALAEEGPVSGRGRDVLMTALMMCDSKLAPRSISRMIELSEKMDYPYLANHVLAWASNPGADPALGPQLRARAAHETDPYVAASARGFLGQLPPE